MHHSTHTRRGPTILHLAPYFYVLLVFVVPLLSLCLPCSLFGFYLQQLSVCGVIRRPGVPPTSPVPSARASLTAEHGAVPRLRNAVRGHHVHATAHEDTLTRAYQRVGLADLRHEGLGRALQLFIQLLAHMLALLCPRCPRVRPVRVRRLALPPAQAQALGCLRGSTCPTAPCPAAGMLWLAGSATTTSPRTTATPGGAACWALRGCEAPSGGLRCGKPPCAGTRTGFLPPARTRPGPGPGPGSGPGPGPRPRSQSQRARCRTG